MAPKSGEVDTAEGETTEPETTEFMDLSTECGSLTPRKRKAEILATANEDEDEEEDEDDGEEEEEDEEEEEEKEVDSCESDQEWDVDSFKDEHFHSSDVSDDDEDWRRYLRQIFKSEGFDVPPDFIPTTRVFGGFYPVDLDEFFEPPNLSGREYMRTMLKVVIEKYNEDKASSFFTFASGFALSKQKLSSKNVIWSCVQKKNLVLDEIVRAVVKMAVGVKAYITFMARESPEGEPVEYQGKAECKVWQRKIHPLLCRPASEQKKKVASLP